MNIKKKGTIVSMAESRDYGFIDYEEEETVFFHVRNVLENLVEGDTVLFEIGDSRRQPGKPEAFYVRKTYPQPNGFDLAMGKYLIATPEALLVMAELLDNEILLKERQDEIIITKALDGKTGYALAIETSIDDEVFYATRKSRKGYYRFVKNKEPKKTNLFTVIINFVPEEEYYAVAACFFGPRTPPAPWDKRAKPDALEFWRGHALIPHDIFSINYDDVRAFDPDFFKSFEDLQGT